MLPQSRSMIMTGTQKAIVPGILLGSLMLIFLNKMVNPPLPALAETVPPPAQTQQKAKSVKPQKTCQYQSRYPAEVVRWCGLIETYAKKHGVDPLLIAAVMLVESGGQPQVMSGSGAVGLLQVMPRDGIAATFQCINGPCFSGRPTIKELKDPEFNINYGVRMLAGLIERDGNARDALFAYGPYDVGYAYADKVLTIFADL